MTKYIFHRGKKITWLLAASQLISVFYLLFMGIFERDFATACEGIVYNLFFISIILYFSVTFVFVDSKRIKAGLFIKKDVHWQKVSEIKREGKYLVFYYLKGKKQNQIKINLNILMPNRSQYLRFFTEIRELCEMHGVFLETGAYELIVNKKPIAVEGLGDEKPGINGWFALILFRFITYGIIFIPYSIYELIVSFNGLEYSFFKGALITLTAFSALLDIVIIITTILIAKKKKSAKKMMVISEIAIALVVILAGWAMAKFDIDEGEYTTFIIILGYIKLTLVTSFIAYAMIIYINTSIRVKRTLGIMSRDEYMEEYDDFIYKGIAEKSMSQPSFYNGAEEPHKPREISQGVPEDLNPEEVTGKSIVSTEIEPVMKMPPKKISKSDVRKIAKYIKDMPDSKNKITFMFYGKVKYFLAKEWYADVRLALKDEFIDINKIFASPDVQNDIYSEYQFTYEYEKTYMDQMFIGKNAVNFKTLGFLCTYKMPTDYMVDSYCFGSISWGRKVYPEGMKLSFDISTAKEADLYRFLKVYEKYIHLSHMHVYEIDYSRQYSDVTQGDYTFEYNKSKKVILDMDF